MAQADARTIAKVRQQGVEKGKGGSIHALVVNHKSSNPGCQGCIKFGEEGLPASSGAVFLAGVQVDVGKKIRQSGRRGCFCFPVP